MNDNELITLKHKETGGEFIATRKALRDVWAAKGWHDPNASPEGTRSYTAPETDPADDTVEETKPRRASRS